MTDTDKVFSLLKRYSINAGKEDKKPLSYIVHATRIYSDVETPDGMKQILDGVFAYEGVTFEVRESNGAIYIKAIDRMGRNLPIAVEKDSEILKIYFLVIYKIKQHLNSKGVFEI